MCTSVYSLKELADKGRELIPSQCPNCGESLVPRWTPIDRIFLRITGEGRVQLLARTLCLKCGHVAAFTEAL